MTIEHWEEITPEATASAEWSHTGIAVLADDTVVFGAPGGGRLIFAKEGKTRTVDVPVCETHGLCLDPRQEAIWIADPGVKARPNRGYLEERRNGGVVLVGLNREADALDPLIRLHDPEPHSETWRPTSVAVAPDGNVWVADGYGRNTLHIFDPGGRPQRMIDGSDSGTPFDCPHGIAVDIRGDEPHIVIADRGNRRLVWLELDGTVRRELRHDALRSPSCIATRGDKLLVTELIGSLAEVTGWDEVRLLVPRSDEDGPEWPNMAGEYGPARPRLQLGQLRAPHGIATGTDGSIYLTEWCIGGRQLRIRTPE